MSKRLLRVVGDAEHGLGVETVMRRELATKHGVRYVHMAAFAIDVDRVLELAPDDDPRPFAWEVFLTERYLITTFDLTSLADRELIEETCFDLLDTDPSVALLGAQLPFAVFDAVQRGVWPSELSALFRAWKGRGAKFVERLGPLWQAPEHHARALAMSCLEADLSPPLAPPTRAALEQMIGTD